MNTHQSPICKIVLNDCYGGFGLSYEAMYLYNIAKGKNAYFYAAIPIYDTQNGLPKDQYYKRIPLSEAKQYSYTNYVYCTTEYLGETVNHALSDVFYDVNVDRTDPVLVSVVETMGSAAASGRFASLGVHEIPVNTLYQIEYYDGLETLITQDDDDWIMAQENECSPDVATNIKSLWSTIKPVIVPDPDLTFKY